MMSDSNLRDIRIIHNNQEYWLTIDSHIKTIHQLKNSILSLFTNYHFANMNLFDDTKEFMEDDEFIEGLNTFYMAIVPIECP
jgi:hypothetical protein